MLTFSETVLNAVIWFLTLAGLCFGLRATRRKQRGSQAEEKDT